MDSIPWLAALAGGLVIVSLSGRRLLTRLASRAPLRPQTPTAVEPGGDDRLDALAASLADITQRLDRIERRLASATMRPKNPSPMPSPPPTRPGEDGDPMSRQIYALADEGLGSLDIARKLNQHRGKVELILALRQG